MIELVIDHDGVNWNAKNEVLSVSSPTLDGLDLALEEQMRNKGLVKKGDKKKVFMAFDNSTIPQWIRQYAQHYFNRVVEISG
ncbi:MAG: hypothetical protein GY710_19695 [Desulfobacteraceae bacterium]|nr:hypothetical protein [Desulfobacteraceae bacterium]